MEYIYSKSFGMIIYMDTEMYKGNEEDIKNIHIPLTHKMLLLMLLKEMYNKKLCLNNIIDQIIVSHEHGEDNHKCHYHIFLEFEKKVRKEIKPGNFKVKDITYLYMAQRCRSPKKFREYVKKGKDFIEMFPGETIKNILKDENILNEMIDADDPYEILLNRNDLSNKNIVDIFKSCSVTEYKKDFMSNSSKILETYNKIIRQPDLDIPEFTWTFPKHIIEYLSKAMDIKNDYKYIAYNTIYKWFKDYCVMDQNIIKRRKALFLFSLRGGVGKSYFARSLVPQIKVGLSPFFVYCRGTLDAAEFQKKDMARLVILDDIKYNASDIEIWKALTVSEPTNIRTPYHNIPWNKSLPCILMTNTLSTFRYWMEAEDLKGRCIFVSIDFYMGPPETEDVKNQQLQCCLSNDVKSKIFNNNNNIVSYLKNIIV